MKDISFFKRNQRGRIYKKWSEQDKATLVSLIKEEVTLKEAANRLGTTENSINAYIYGEKIGRISKGKLTSYEGCNSYKRVKSRGKLRHDVTIQILQERIEDLNALLSAAPFAIDLNISEGKVKAFIVLE